MQRSELICGPVCRAVAMFYEDDGIEERFRSRLSDYRGSGYDRGHMVPTCSQPLVQH
jgi:DNA/RNA endonuclease G (NUC1)